MKNPLQFFPGSLLAAAVFALFPVSLVAQDDPARTYTIKGTDTAPTLDGVVSPGEWDSAEIGNQFRETGSCALDTDVNAEFRALWTDDALYILYRSRQPSFGFGTSFGNADDSFNLYIDPNTDDEDNFNPPDGYQIAVWLIDGEEATRDTAPNVFTEAHGDTGFGNNAGWDGGAFPDEGGWDYASKAEAGNGVIEMRIPFDDLSADPDEIYGLNYQDRRPQVGEKWYLGVNQITSLGFNIQHNCNGVGGFTNRPHTQVIFGDKAGVRSVVGVENDDLTSGTPDGWDLSVTLTNRIVGPDGASAGTVTHFSYYAQPSSGVPDEYVVTPLLLKQEDGPDGIYTVAAVGKGHVPEEQGPQLQIPFETIEGNPSFDTSDATISYHIAFMGQRPDFANNDAGGIVPFGDGGPGMFAMDTDPFTDFGEGDEFFSGHASGAGGRDYQFNFTILWDTSDTDKDGMPNFWEDQYDLDPNDAADAAGDGDGDQLSNLDEFRRGSNPTLADTDGDGLSDKVETNTGVWVSATDTGTDPAEADTDEDGLPDGVETNTGTFVEAENTGTNPLLANSDGDDFDDGTELGCGSNPNDANSGCLAGYPNLLFWADFDAIDNGVVSDVIGGYRIDVGGPSLTADGGGRTGKAGDKGIDFAGGAGAVVEDASFMNVAATVNKLTVAFWQNVEFIGNSSSFWATSPSSSGGQRGAQGHATWGDGNTYWDTVGCCDGGTQRISGPAGPVEGEWEHWVFVKDGDNKAVYKNGEVVAEGVNTSPLPTDFERFFIGSDNNNGNPVNGVIDDMAVYADALTLADIAILAKGARPTAPGNTEDSDGGGAPDWWEELWGFDPGNAADEGGDEDGDGVTNGAEYAKGTSPEDGDTDGDGLADGIETGTGTFVSATDTGTSPLVADTDGDGLSDLVETGTGTFVDAEDTGTDPNKADTDGDKCQDGFEVAEGQNPHVQDCGAVPTFHGRPDYDVEDGGPDGWDITVILTTPIAPPEGISLGIVDHINYFAATARDGSTDAYTVAPILVIHDLATNQWRVEGVGALHSAEESGPQTKVPFNLQRGTNIIDASREGITYHAGFFNGQIDGIADNNGGIVPFGAAGGPGMFGYNNAPDEELQPGQVLTSGHASGAGGRNYNFNLGVLWSDEDSDGDTMPDIYEIQNDLDPNLNDAALDADGDGATNLEEFENGTNPQLADTDGDGLNDGAETGTGVFVSATNAGSSPTNPDSDGDGLTDGEEVADHGTDPNKADTDGDGDNDAFELAWGGDPNDPGRKAQLTVTTGVYTGGDPGEGLDLEGDFLYAVNISGFGPAGQAGDADFTDDMSTDGFTVEAVNDIPNWGGQPDYGDTEADDAIENMSAGIRWTARPGGVHLMMENLTPGARYKLQTMHVERCCDRGWDVFLDGALVLDDFNAGRETNGSPGDVGASAGGAVVTIEFVASSDTINVELNGTNSPFPDGNAILNGVTLEALGGGGTPFQIRNVVTSPTEVTLVWDSRSNVEYAVEYKADLSEPVWIEIDDGVASEGVTTSFTDDDPTRVNLPEGYYRVREN